MKFLMFFALGATGFAHAAGVPSGNFDCSQKKGLLHVTIDIATPGVFLKVDHEMDSETTTLEGYGLVASLKLADGTLLNHIRLPGSNFELYFDDQGRVGLARDRLDCRKM